MNQDLETKQNSCDELEKRLVEQQSLVELGQLSAGIAHELKNPLNLIKNFNDVSLELVEDLQEALSSSQEGSEDPNIILNDLKQNIRRISEHTGRAIRIVKGILATAAHGQQGERQPSDINKLMETYVMLAYHAWRAKDPTFNASLRKELGEHIPLVEIMEEDIGRVILNVADNAFQALNQYRKSQPPGYQPTFLMKTLLIRDHIKIELEDNGPGIPKDIREKIFSPFFTTKSRGEGTGLGLAIAWKIIVEQHGGQIEVISSEGQGATFLISLPLKVPSTLPPKRG